jgi:hypothetical protein
MINYKVFDVGDALFSTFDNNEVNSLKSIFDFGYSRINKFHSINQNEYLDAKTLLLSHFHRDHYKAIFKLEDKSLSIKNLVIPRLPFDEIMAKGLKSFLAIQLFYLAEFSGFYETDLINIIRTKNRGQISIERKSINETFLASNFKFQVIWPDPNYISNIQSVLTALQDIAYILEENEEFKKFYNEVLDSDFFNEEIVSISDEEIRNLKPFELKLTDIQRKLMRSANLRLIRLANDNCLAFQNLELKFLSLGDLSNRALWDLFDKHFKEPFEYEIILSAHHGTHFTNHINWKNIKSCVIVHSNGSRMKDFYKTEYDNLSNNNYQIYHNSEFSSMQHVRNCRLKKIK